MSFFISPFKRQRSTPDLELPPVVPTPPLTTNNLATTALLNDQNNDSDDNTFSIPAIPAGSVSHKAAFFESLTSTVTNNNNSSIQLQSQDSSSEDGNSSHTVWINTPTINSNNNTHEYSLIETSSSAPTHLPSALLSPTSYDNTNNTTTTHKLQQELSQVHAQHKLTLELLRRREQEIQNLTNVIKQLSESRAAAISARATLTEKYIDLQREHSRVMRVADLSRTVSQENVALTKSARSAAEVAAKAAELARKDALLAGIAEERAMKENIELKEKMSLLERMALDDVVDSVIKKEFISSRVCETY